MPLRPGSAPRASSPRDTTGIGVKRVDERRTRRREGVPVRARARNDQHQARALNITRLQLRGTDLRLEVGEARDHLDRDPHVAGPKQHIDGAQVAGDRDRRLEHDAPRVPHTPQELGDVASLRLVAQRAAPAYGAGQRVMTLPGRSRGSSRQRET
jgi:hypothetical protein